MSNRTEQTLTTLSNRIVKCRRCPELRAYCAEIGKTKRRAYLDWDYWARPVPGFGDPSGSIMIVGLAPAAHGANRTGRMFTGDRSGDFLYAALHRAGLANQPESVSRGDGLELSGVFITAPLRCAPPANKPTGVQLSACREYLLAELELVQPNVVVCLGGIAWRSMLTVLAETDLAIPRPRPKFAHGSECIIGKMRLLGCYHVSQQNTFTGRLTEPMIDSVFARARSIAGS